MADRSVKTTWTPDHEAESRCEKAAGDASGVIAVRHGSWRYEVQRIPRGQRFLNPWSPQWEELVFHPLGWLVLLLARPLGYVLRSPVRLLRANWPVKVGVTRTSTQKSGHRPKAQLLHHESIRWGTCEGERMESLAEDIRQGRWDDVSATYTRAQRAMMVHDAREAAARAQRGR